MRTATIAIDGMSCGGCIESVRRVLARTPGVTVVEVVVGQARVALDASAEAALRCAIDDAGFTARELRYEP